MAVIYIQKSENIKVGKNVDCTYLPLSTCSKSCSLKDKGCYAKMGYVGIITARLAKASVNKSSLHIAQEEAKAIISNIKSENKYLRLHVSGDFKTKNCAKVVNDAVGKWKNNPNKVVWSYTHSWKDIPREYTSNISMLASVKNISEANLAIELGYAPAIVVDIIKNKSFTLPGSKVRFISCRSQTEDITCVECKLCFNADILHKKGLGIAFAAHGNGKEGIKRRLNVLG